MTEKEKLALKFRGMGIDERVVRAFEKVMREEFVLPSDKKHAYYDSPIPIKAGQTISQPTTVVVMLDALELEESDKVLEIGAGSGYNAALLGEICKKGRIISVEFIDELVSFAKSNIQKAGLKNVLVVKGDGTKGYAREAPYNKIICTAAIPEIPKEWIEQLADGGIIVAPVGPQFSQKMTKLKKAGKGYEVAELGDFVFVPARGEHGYDI